MSNIIQIEQKAAIYTVFRPRAVQAQLACLGRVADSAVGRLEKETGLVPAAVARDFQRTVSKVAFPGLKKKTGSWINDIFEVHESICYTLPSLYMTVVNLTFD